MKKIWIPLALFSIVVGILLLYIFQKTETPQPVEKIIKKETTLSQKEDTPPSVIPTKDRFEMSAKDRYEEEHEINSSIVEEQIEYVKEDNLSAEELVPLEAEMSQEDREEEQNEDENETVYIPKEMSQEPMDNDLATELRLKEEEEIQEQELMIEEDMAQERDEAEIEKNQQDNN